MRFKVEFEVETYLDLYKLKEFIKDHFDYDYLSISELKIEEKNI